MAVVNGVTYTVSNSSELQVALASAQGGETVILKDGNYGNLTLTKDYSEFVTMRAENTQGVTFDKVHIKGGSYINFDGVNFNGGLTGDSGADHLTVTNSYSDSGMYFKKISNLVLDNNDIANSHKTLILNDVVTFQVTNNDIHSGVEDIMQITGDSSFGLIANNIIRDPHPPIGSSYHPDLIQVFDANGLTPHDITIRNNLIFDTKHDGTEKGSQGIFMTPQDKTNSFYKNILIEENLLTGTMTNGITVATVHAENVIVQNNTLLGGNLRVGDPYTNISDLLNEVTFKGNIAPSASDSSPGKVFDFSDNYITKYGAGQQAVFIDPSDPSSFEAYLPKAGSAIDFGSSYGAQKFLLGLMDGSIKIGPVFNHNPVAVDDAYTLNEDTLLSGNILTNDSDVDNDDLATSLVNSTTHGDLVLKADGSFTYTPNANFFGSDSFTYSISDGKGGEDTATVNFTVNDVAEPRPNDGTSFYDVDDYTTVNAGKWARGSGDSERFVLTSKVKTIMDIGVNGGKDVVDVDGVAASGHHDIKGFGKDDLLDISDLLDKYDPIQDSINDFVSIYQKSWSGQTHTFVAVDRDGGGDHFAAAILLRGVKDFSLEQIVVHNET